MRLRSLAKGMKERKMDGFEALGAGLHLWGEEVK